MLPVFELVPGSGNSSWHFNVRRANIFPFDWHYHQECELTLILSGSGQRFVGDSVQRYERGDLVLIGSNVPHTWRSESEGPQSAITCQFRPDFLGSALLEAPEFGGLKLMLERSALGLRFDGDATVERQRIQALSARRAAGRTTELLDVLVALSERRPVTLSARSVLPQASAIGQRRIEAVLGYIDREYSNELTLGLAADAVGMTARSLSRFFRERTSRTFTDYVNDVRCAAASRLLIETELSVSRIALECGYANLANFNRRFYERFALSPRAYRNSFLSR